MGCCAPHPNSLGSQLVGAVCTGRLRDPAGRPLGSADIGQAPVDSGTRLRQMRHLGLLLPGERVIWSVPTGLHGCRLAEP
jgi:hypothetical protein